MRTWGGGVSGMKVGLWISQEGRMRRRMTLRKLDVMKALRWTQGVVDFSGKVLDSWDTYHYPDEGQVLTTIIGFSTASFVIV